MAIACFAVPSLAWTALGAEGSGCGRRSSCSAPAVYAVLLWRLRRVLRVDVLISAVFRSGRGGAMQRRPTGEQHAAQAPPGRPWWTVLRSVATGWGMLTAGFGWSRRSWSPARSAAAPRRCSACSPTTRTWFARPWTRAPATSTTTTTAAAVWYRAHFPIRALARWRARGPVQTFECSGYYMFHPLAPGRIAAELPDARVVVMLRNPVDRAVSAYGHERRRGFESAGFVDALAREQERLADEVDRLDPRRALPQLRPPAPRLPAAR